MNSNSNASGRQGYKKPYTFVCVQFREKYKIHDAGLNLKHRYKLQTTLKRMVFFVDKVKIPMVFIKILFINTGPEAVVCAWILAKVVWRACDEQTKPFGDRPTRISWQKMLHLKDLLKVLRGAAKSSE